MNGFITKVTGKKRLGAYFTPDKYVKISTGYLRNAISRIPKGWDYIILDRCAGTGNLEKFLTNEELSHCILNTYVYAEWTTLKGLYEDRVRCIIPHTKDYKDPDGLLSDGDALTEEFHWLITDIIQIERKKVKGKLVIIGLENPPYSEPQAEATRSGKTHKQNSWVKDQMKKNVKGKTSTDLANQFIWSMTQNYVDEYVVFAPIKYWKSQHLLDGKFNEGHLCNRKKFHAASEAGISLISWTIDNKINNDFINVDSDLGEVKLRKIYKGMGKLFVASKNTKYDFIMTSYSGTPDYKHGCLSSNTKAVGNAGGVSYCKIEEDVYRLPLFAANCYKPKDYTEKEIIMKSGDGGTVYQEDKDFLNDCFVWSCLTAMNKCVSDNQIKNELCLLQDTKANKLFDRNKRNAELLGKWQKILKTIKETEEYNSEFTYGLHQICKDVNIKVETGDYRKNGSQIKAHKYDDLNNLIKEFKEQLDKFYNEYITPKLFDYELLK